MNGCGCLPIKLYLQKTKATMLGYVPKFIQNATDLLELPVEHEEKINTRVINAVLFKVSTEGSKC